MPACRRLQLGQEVVVSLPATGNCSLLLASFSARELSLCRLTFCPVPPAGLPPALGGFGLQAGWGEPR